MKLNCYIYSGRQVILPEQLTERDSTKIALPYGADGAVVPVRRFRDVQKLCAAMTDGKMSDPDVLACMDNYHVRLIAPAQMTDGEIMKFQSSLREVMLFIKYSKDKENLSRVLAANEKRFRAPMSESKRKQLKYQGF